MGRSRDKGVAVPCWTEDYMKVMMMAQDEGEEAWDAYEAALRCYEEGEYPLAARLLRRAADRYRMQAIDLDQAATVMEG